MATCSINNNELEIILTNDAQNTISVDSAIETYSDVLECKIQSKDIILEKVDNSIVVLELTINGSKYVTEATLVDDENSFIKINEETLHLVKDNKSSNNVLEESVEEVEEVKVDELTKFLGEKIEDFTNQKLTEKVEEIKTFSSNTLYENLETFEEKKKDLLELVEEQFTNVVDGVKSDVNKKLDRFFKRTDLNNKTAIAIETDRLKEEITEKYNSFLAELNNKKKNLEEINGDKVNQLVEDKKEEITNVIKLFVEKIYSEYKEEFNPQLKNIITENKQLNEKIQQLEDIKKDLVNNKVYSEDITRAENNFKKLLKETNKKFNKVNEKLNLISKKDNTRYNSLLAAINDTDTKEYETVLNNKIEQAELGQIKEELEQSLTSSMQSEVTSLKRYVEMSAGGGTNSKQYANGGRMDGDLHVTGTVTAGGTIKSTSYEYTDFPTTTSVKTTAAFKDDGTMVQDEKVIVVKVSGARAQAMTTTESSYLELIPAPGPNKVLVIRELEIYIERGTWTPMSGGTLRGWGNNLQLVIETPANTVSGYGSSGKYNTFATFQKKFLNHTFNNGVFVAAGAVDTIIVRDAPATQVRAYPDKPLLLRPEAVATYNTLIDYEQTVDDNYFFRITYKIMDMTSDFTADTSII